VTAPASLRQPTSPASQPPLILAPTSAGRDWSDWVSATKTRNFLLGDPLLDWLDLHGESQGFVRDDQLAGYDPRSAFGPFLFEKGFAFEARVVDLLRERCEVLRIAESGRDARDSEKAKATLAAMKAGVEVIHGAVLHDEGTRTYGVPDLLVRADVLGRLFPAAYAPELERAGGNGPAPSAQAAPALGNGHHYRVVDCKFTTLGLLKSGELDNDGSARAYKGQLFLYNQMLGATQGFLPPAAFLLGRSWTKGKDRGQGCFERLAPVLQAGMLSKDESIADAVEAAVSWVRRVRKDGGAWSPLPSPTVPELRSNLCNGSDAPWSDAKSHIAKETGELTAMWYLGLDKRDALLARTPPISRWDDPALSASVAGVRGEVVAPRFDAILDINRDMAGPPVRPDRVTVQEGEWRVPEALEFFVDFETVSDLDDDFSRLPARGGQPLIFMVGCAHVEDGQLRFRCFTADALTPQSEARVLDAWFAHMEDVRRRLGFEGQPRVFHWSPAERTSLVTAYNSAQARHPEQRWSEPRWFDFLNQVVKAEPVVVRGALGFGLKAIGKALHAHGLIQTEWADGPTDGLGAMVGAWRAAAEAKERGVSLRDVALMQEIERYNEVDCLVMYEVISYVRSHH
jgi:hypothetical protein